MQPTIHKTMRAAQGTGIRSGPGSVEQLARLAATATPVEDEEWDDYDWELEEEWAARYEAEAEFDDAFGDFEERDDLRRDCPNCPECGCGVDRGGTSPLGTILARLRLALQGDDGMSTTEYAIGTLSAAAFAALLYVIVSGDAVSSALEGLFQRALSTRVG